MQALPSLSRRLLSLQAAQALCARTGSGHAFELPCVIAQLQLLSGSAPAAAGTAPSGYSGLHTLTAWTPQTSAMQTTRQVHTTAAAAVAGRGLDFVVSLGVTQILIQLCARC